MMRPRLSSRTIAALAGALTLGACSTFSPDGGMSVVADVADQELRKDVVAIRTQDDDAAAHARVQRLLKRPLTADTAVQIALLNNRGLQAAYNELGIAEADDGGGEPAAQSDVLDVERLSGPVEIEIERGSSPTFSRSRRCRRAPRSPPTASGRRNCAPPRKRCASPPRRAAPTTARSPRASSAASSTQAQARGRNRDASWRGGSAKPAP